MCNKQTFPCICTYIIWMVTFELLWHICKTIITITLILLKIVLLFPDYLTAHYCVTLYKRVLILVWYQCLDNYITEYCTTSTVNLVSFLNPHKKIIVKSAAVCRIKRSEVKSRWKTVVAANIPARVIERNSWYGTSAKLHRYYRWDNPEPTCVRIFVHITSF